MNDCLKPFPKDSGKKVLWLLVLHWLKQNSIDVISYYNDVIINKKFNVSTKYLMNKPFLPNTTQQI